MQLTNEVFRQGNQHEYAYDEERLLLVLRRAGFAKAIRQSFDVCLDEDMAPDNENRKSESLYVESVKGFEAVSNNHHSCRGARTPRSRVEKKIC